MSSLAELEKIIKIKFKDKDLLQEALTHRSFLNEIKKGVKHNERLEFLGDAVLELSVTNFLFSKFSKKNEGDLTSLRAALVNSKMLFEVGDKIGLYEFIRLSRGEARDTGKAKSYILANAMEALIGAIYLDQGYDSADKFIIESICSHLDSVLDNKLWCDAKSLFQEKAQEVTGITPNYDVIQEKGPDHKKFFIVGVYLEEELVAKGEGFSKQEAQMQAAENGLKAKSWED